MDDLDDWLRLLDEGRALYWTGEQVPTEGSATVPRQVLTAMRLGRWYWVGRRHPYNTLVEESWHLPLAEREAVKPLLARARGAPKLDVGKPYPERLSDPLEGLTHRYEFERGNHYQVDRIYVARAKAGGYTVTVGWSIYDGMGASDARSSPVDLAGALATIEDAFREGYAPSIDPVR